MRRTCEKLAAYKRRWKRVDSNFTGILDDDDLPTPPVGDNIIANYELPTIPLECEGIRGKCVAMGFWMLSNEVSGSKTAMSREDQHVF